MVKISNGKPHYNEVGRFGQGELSRPTTHVNYRPNRTDRLDLILHLAGGYYCILAGRRDTFLISGKSSANEKPPHLKLPVYSGALLVYNSFPNLPFLLKKACLSIVPWTCLWFCPGLFVWTAMLFYFQINPSFAAKITGFYF